MWKFIRMCLLFSLITFTSITDAKISPKRILILHSYDPSYQWTNDLQKGIDDANVHSGSALKLSIEYLDTKRIFDESHLDKSITYFEKKCQNYQFDGVIVSDDNALLFLKKINMKNIRNLPTVAVGIGDKNASLSSVTSKGIIVYEKDYIRENIELILKLQPKMKNLYYLADRSITSNLIESEFRRILSNYPNIHVEEIRDRTLKEAQALLENASPNDAVLLTHFNTETNANIYYNYDQIAYAIGQSSKPPVFVFWKFYIQNGVLGGYVTNSYELGRSAVSLLLNQIPDLNVASSASTNVDGYFFDYKTLQKHSINERMLPNSALYLGKPESFVQANWRVLLVASSIIAVLIAIIIFLTLLLRRKRIINRQNVRILELQKKTVNVQKDLIYLLGDAIETRSGETGNHVKRVAKMSAKLGELCGLPESDCELLEVVSPMHDIGKIGIPEAVLEKPGRLSPDEWKIMQSHVDIGYRLLNSSEGEILHFAAIIALEHHEHWNGKGYPAGKTGESIHVFSRITTIVDVFDALLSERCYKKAWPLNQAVDLLKEQQGQQFYPHLTSIFLENIQEFMHIREKYPDK